MNSFGAMSSSVKQPLPTVLAPPTISNSSPSKVQPPNLTPLNLNTTSQSAQPLSLVNEHKNVPVFVSPVENIVQKSSACNGVPDGKSTTEKIEGVTTKIESKLSHNQVNDSVTGKNSSETAVTELKPRASEVENLSPKKDDKSNLPISQTDKILSGVTETSANEPIKIEKSPKPDVIKPKENDTKANPESNEIQSAVQTNLGQIVLPGKIDQSSPNTTKNAVRRKREHKVSLTLQFIKHLEKNAL